MSGTPVISAAAALTKHLRHTLSVCMNLHLQRKCLTVSGCIRGSTYHSRQYSACNKHIHIKRKHEYMHIKRKRLTGRQHRSYSHWRWCSWHWSACTQHICSYAANAHTTYCLCMPCSKAGTYHVYKSCLCYSRPTQQPVMVSL